MSFWPCQLFVGGVGGIVLKSVRRRRLNSPHSLGPISVLYIREFVVVAYTSSVARAQEPRASPWRCCCCGGRERETHTKVATILVFHLSGIILDLVQKKICLFRRRTHQDEGEVSEGGKRPRFFLSRRPSTVGIWQRDSLERLALGGRDAGVAATTSHHQPPSSPPSPLMMDSFGRFWSLLGAALRTRCG